jgi:hypothetical protein
VECSVLVSSSAELILAVPEGVAPILAMRAPDVGRLVDAERLAIFAVFILVGIELADSDFEAS